MNITEVEIRKLTVQPDEVLLVRLPAETRHQDVVQFIKKVTEKLGHQRIFCYIGEIEFSKVKWEGNHEATEKAV